MRYALAVALLLASCSTSEEPAATPAGDPGRYDAPPPMTVDAAKTYTATVDTSKGTFVLALDAARAPVTVNNFVFLARERFYDGLTFHRVEAGFVIQGGDPKGDGTGGPGYTIADEASGLSHGEGALGMAKSAAPNSAGSQFYVTLAPQPSLDGRYTVFGSVSSGLEVVKSIARGDVIQRVTITEQ
mgnify:CR=1 FL=1